MLAWDFNARRMRRSGGPGSMFRRKEGIMLRDRTAVGPLADEVDVGPTPVERGQDIFARQFARRYRVRPSDGRRVDPLPLPPPPGSFPPSIPPGVVPVGWLCPQCMATNAPWVSSCKQCGPALTVKYEGDR